MAIVNATDVVIRLIAGSGSPADLLLHATSASLSVSRDLRDSTTKSSLGFSESLAGLKSWEMSGDGFVDFTTTASNQNAKQLLDQMLLDDPVVEVSFGLIGTTVEYTGTAFITSMSIDAGVEENATYSLSLTGTGSIA